MNVKRWQPEIGDHIWHVMRYHLNDAELKKKGLDGFRGYGVEVVESVITKKGEKCWESEAVKLDVGTEKRRLWEDAEITSRAFRTKEKAVILAEKIAYDMDHVLGKRYENRPMYKNWLQWENIQKKY